MPKKQPRWKIQRYSPIRKKWKDFDGPYDTEKEADDRAIVLKVRHMSNNLKFKVVLVR